MYSLDRILWLIMALPYFALVCIPLVVRLRPIWGTLHKYGHFWPKALVIGQQLVKDDAHPMHWNVARTAGFLAFVLAGGKWLVYWWPAGPEARIAIGPLFVFNSIFIAIYTLFITWGSWIAWNEGSEDETPWEYTKDLLYKLFVPGDWEFPLELALIGCLVLPCLFNTLNGQVDKNDLKNEVTYASVNHHAEVAQDRTKIYNVRFAALTRTLCQRAMTGDGNLAFAEEGSKDASRAQYYARCIVLLNKK